MLIVSQERVTMTKPEVAQFVMGIRAGFYELSVRLMLYPVSGV
jgi:hypothetical protein